MKPKNDLFSALFDAKKHIYDPSNPFSHDEKLAKSHQLNPAYVQWIQEEQQVEVIKFLTL